MSNIKQLHYIDAVRNLHEQMELDAGFNPQGKMYLTVTEYDMATRSFLRKAPSDFLSAQDLENYLKHTGKTLDHVANPFFPIGVDAGKKYVLSHTVEVPANLKAMPADKLARIPIEALGKFQSSNLGANTWLKLTFTPKFVLPFKRYLEAHILRQFSNGVAEGMTQQSNILQNLKNPLSVVIALGVGLWAVFGRAGEKAEAA